VLVYLDARLETIARRQNRTDWTLQRLEAQRVRLEDARAHCDFYLRTDDLTREEVAKRVAAFLLERDVSRLEDTTAGSGWRND
jgi:hypothetical protein